MDIKSYVEDLDIPFGESRRINCPVCNSYKTFTATNNMGKLLWNCYKASCSVSGNTRAKVTADDLRKMYGDQEASQLGTFEMPSYVVNRSGGTHMNRWCARWDIDAEALGLMYDVKEDRVVFPVIHEGLAVDAAGRALGKRLPKWKRYGNSGLPYTYGCGKVAVVVEDCVSAAVVGEYGSFVGVAILGTSLSESHKRYLAQFSTAIMALDPDALLKTLQFKKELSGYVNDVKVLRLNDDIKYQNPDDMERLLAFQDI